MDKSIDQSQPASEQPVTEPELSQGNPRIPKYLAVTSITLAAIVGYLVLANFQHWFSFGSQRMAISTPTPTPTGTITPTPTAVNVAADWKVYLNRNYEYGVKFKYPPTFTFETCGPDGLSGPTFVGFDDSAVIKSSNVGCSTDQKSYGIIFNFKAGTFTDFREAVDSLSTWHLNNFRPIRPVGPFARIEEIGPDGSSSSFYIAKFPHSDSYIRVVTIPTTRMETVTMKVVDYERIAQAIFSTFEFVEPLPGPLTKIYRNEKYGFEFKYPSNWGIRNDWGYGLNIGELYVGFIEFQSLDPTKSIVDAPSQQELLKEKNDIDLTGVLVNGRKIKTTNFYSPSGGDYIRMATFFGGKSGNDEISLSIVINPTNFQELKDAGVPADVVVDNPENEEIVETFNSIVSTLSFF